MSERIWFVMLRTQKGLPTPMLDSDDPDLERVKLFSDEDEAERVAGENPLGRACGYEVYEWQ